jgi:uncharacterized membrane protein YkoI
MRAIVMRIFVMRIFAICAVLVLLAFAPPPAAVAQDPSADCRRAQDCALDALQSGEIRPLPEVLAVAREKLPGELVKVELEREDGIWVYEIKILTPSGKRREIEIDARTLAVIKID